MQMAISENKILINIYLVFLSFLADNLHAKKVETPHQQTKINNKTILSNLIFTPLNIDFSFRLLPQLITILYQV